MSRIQILRLLVNERLTAAAEEIFGVFERTIEEYEDEINHQRKQLDALKPEFRTDYLARQLLVCEEEVHPEQQERSPSLLHRLEQPDVIELTLCPDSMKCENNGENNLSSQLSQTQDPEPLQIKEEQEELLQNLEEDDGSRITVLPVKREDGQEKTQSFQSLQTRREKNGEAYYLPSTSTEQMKTEPGGEDCGVSEPDSNLYPPGDLEPTRDWQLLSSDCSGTETDDSYDWKESEEPRSGVKRQKRPSLSNSRTLKRSMELSHELKSSGHILSTPHCKVCGSSFLDMVSLMLHIHIHSSDCGLCGTHLDQTESLKLHLESHRTCDVCVKEFTTHIELVGHMRSHSGEKPFICSDCGKEFEWRIHLQIHMRMHTGEKPFSCSFCGKGFSEKGGLKIHMRTHTGEKPFSCSVCGNGFRHKGNLMKHMRIHTGEKPFSCSVCGKTFAQKGKVKMHMLTHTGEKPFSCSVCGKGFSEKGNLKKHMRLHTGEKPFSCSICGKTFTRKETLKLHMRSHTGEKLFSCSITGEKPFSCSVCGKGFSRKLHLQTHMRSHTGEKPFSCSVCGKWFSDKGNLKRHMVSHTGEKPFHCSICGKGFSQSGNLKNHMRTHTGEKPFSCSVCGKWFSDKGNLKRHMMGHTGEKPFSCSVSGKGLDT